MPLECKQAPLVLKLLLYTGMKPAEMFALDKKDIDLQKRIVSINKEMGSDRDNLNVVRQCKTEMSIRKIPMSDKVFEVITELMSLSNSDILIPNSKGQHYATKDIADRYHHIAKNHGVDFHMYQCRHTFITTLFMQGVDLKTIQELVGQKIDATTIGYVVSDEQRKKNAMNLM